jgi:hypothetical protein
VTGAPGVTAEVSGHVAGSPEAVFELFQAIDVTTILTGFGPLPAVASVTNPTGRWDEPGQERTLHLADGSSLCERMTAVDPARSFSYELDQISGPLRHLVRVFSGCWSFEPAAGDRSRGFTRAHWRYVFEPHSWITWPATVFIVKCLWQPYMRRVLARASAQARERA